MTAADKTDKLDGLLPATPPFKHGRLNTLKAHGNLRTGRFLDELKDRKFDDYFVNFDSSIDK